MPLIKSGSRQAISTNIREMMAGHPQKQAIAAALSTARRYARGGDAQRGDDDPRLYVPKRLEGDPIPLGMLDRASRAGTRNDVEINDQISRQRDKWSPPTFEQRWRGAPQQPRFIEDEYGRMQNVYAEGGDVESPNDDPFYRAAQRVRGRGPQRSDLTQYPDHYGRLVSGLESLRDATDPVPPPTGNLSRDLGQAARFSVGALGAGRGAGNLMRSPNFGGVGTTHFRLPDGSVLRRNELINNREFWSRNGRFIRDPEQGGLPPWRADGGRAYASGGDIMPWQERASGRALVHAGMIKSPVPGRTDKLPISVGGGAYVLPADHVAALGQNNSMAGGNILDSMFKMGHFGAPKSTKPRMPRFGLRRKMFAEGGAPDSGKPVQIIAAGGEYVVPPEVVAEIGGGDMDKGHAALDRWVKQTRRHHIKTLRKLKPPKQS